MHRRRFIGTVSGGIATVGLSGCLGLGGDDNGVETETGSPGAIVESWYRLLYNADAEERNERLEDVWHSDSPTLDGGGNQQGQLTGELDSVDTEVISQELTESELQEQLGVWAEETPVSRLADEEEAAVVEITSTVTLETGQSGEGTERYLVVTEDGSWQIMLLLAMEEF